MITFKGPNRLRTEHNPRPRQYTTRRGGNTVSLQPEMGTIGGPILVQSLKRPVGRGHMDPATTKRTRHGNRRSMPIVARSLKPVVMTGA